MMKREYPDVPLVGVGAIIIEGERVVLVKRGHPPLAGEWSIPGGMLELGETVSQAAVREALEETSLEVEVVCLLGVYDRVLRDADDRTRYHYVLIDFLCRKVSGDCRAADDATEARWFTREEVGSLGLPQDTADAIRLGFENQSEGASARK
jgi:ADP-ribose pyrophosphatase YjhB (NUDIX family)